ncbi:MAG: type IV secretory system conjugative DNA transfer family protein [Paracoccaceae bacterium]
MLRTLVDTPQARLPGADERCPVPFMVDEFSSLGDMGDVSQTMTSIYGYGGRFTSIVTQLAGPRRGPR